MKKTKMPKVTAKTVAPKAGKAKAVAAKTIAPKARAKMTSLSSVKAYSKKKYGF